MIYICDRVPLEAKKNLWVVKVEDEHFFLATHEQGISLLSRLKLPPEEEKEFSTSPTKSNFLQKLFLRAEKQQVVDEEKQQTIITSPEKESLAPLSSQIPTQFEVVSDGQDTPSK